jgi:hypothetical protein
MYSLRYVNYKNALLLQKISHHNYGIHYFDAVKLLNLGYPFTSYHWESIERLYESANDIGTYLDEDFFHILQKNQATLCFLEPTIPGKLGHYVILYRIENNIMIRDPQINYNGYLDDYIYGTSVLYFNLYILYNSEHVMTQDNEVKRKHICQLFSCETYEDIDKFYKKTYKKTEKDNKKKSFIQDNTNYNSLWNIDYNN